jgi:cytochrome c553
VLEMVQFRSGLRENKVMQHVTEKLTDDEIAALVEYIATK